MGMVRGTIVLMSLAWFAAIAVAAEREPALQLNIASQPVGDALNEFARQSGLQVVIDPKEGKGVNASSVVGEFTARDALDKLLANTGLRFEYLNERTVAVRAAKSLRESKAAAQGLDSDSLQLTQVDATAAQSADSSSASAEDSENESDKQALSDSSKVDQIVVTAQKREERLQDVPISISVVGGDALEQADVQSVAEALNRVPGVISALHTRAGGNTTQVVIRGVGSQGAGSSTSGYYLDSIPWGFVTGGAAPDSNPYDLDRIEVLRGPQGTLYGASALSGVVRILTKDANLDTFDIKGRASVSSTDEGNWGYRGDMALNVPIIEGKLAARAVLGYQDLPGWIDKPNEKDANHGQIKNFRLKVNAAPTEQFSLGLSAWFNRSDFGAPNNSPDGRQAPSLIEEPSSDDYDAFNAKLSYQFTAFSVTSTTSYIDFIQKITLDNNAFSPGIFAFGAQGSEVFAQEVLLNSSHSGPWRWSLGGIYRDAEDTVHTDVLPILPDLVDDGITSESFAVFGEVGRSFGDGQFELTAGLRYFEDEVGRENFITGETTGPDKFDATTPRVVFSWHPREQTTVYASYAEGFRSGLSQISVVQQVAPNFPQLQPDTLKNYEVGMKGNFWSDRGAFDAAVFFQDWVDVQQSLGILHGGTGLPVFLNGESASGMGFEVGATLSPIERLALSGSFSWNDLTFDNDVVSFAGTPPAPVVLFAEGERLSLSPEMTASLAADYRFPLGSAGFDGRVSVSANYISEQTNRQLVGAALLLPDGDDLLTGRASFKLASPKRWSATLFVDNIGNENGVGAEDLFLPEWNVCLRPRTVGVQFEYQLD